MADLPENDATRAQDPENLDVAEDAAARDGEGEATESAEGGEEETRRVEAARVVRRRRSGSKQPARWAVRRRMRWSPLHGPTSA